RAVVLALERRRRGGEAHPLAQRLVAHPRVGERAAVDVSGAGRVEDFHLQRLDANRLLALLLADAAVLAERDHRAARAQPEDLLERPRHYRRQLAREA